MSKSLGQIPQINNSNYLCMVICCEGQGYIARSVEGQSWLKDKYINLTYFHFILSLLINILLHKRIFEIQKGVHVWLVQELYLTVLLF